MSKKSSGKSQQAPQPAPDEPSLLASLLQAKGFTASETPKDESSPAQREAKMLDLSKMGKIVLRRERKGRGGKTVTLVSGITLPVDRLEIIARAMRKGLGCGSTVEQGSIVLQGDIVQRAQDWLRAHGATKLVVGS